MGRSATRRSRRGWRRPRSPGRRPACTRTPGGCTLRPSASSASVLGRDLRPSCFRRQPRGQRPAGVGLICHAAPQTFVSDVVLRLQEGDSVTSQRRFLCHRAARDRGVRRARCDAADALGRADRDGPGNPRHPTRRSSLGAPRRGPGGDVRRFHPGRGAHLRREHDRERDHHRRRCRSDRQRPRPPDQRSFTPPEPLQATFSKSTWTALACNDPLTISFKQLIKATDALRTGTDSKTLTFTLSTTTP